MSECMSQWNLYSRDLFHSISLEGKEYTPYYHSFIAPAFYGWENCVSCALRLLSLTREYFRWASNAQVRESSGAKIKLNEKNSSF